MEYIIGNEYYGYQLEDSKTIKEINSLGLIFKHLKSGARLMVISNDDENKVFSISFRTPPNDSTGVAHILEHSVLCGSKNFPAKDPFVELAKGSLNTFLNAMTFSDKTMYPIASVNDKDFQNLMHVYLDAVFYPNIYEREEIFKQEGWHYKLENENADLIYNGVVYNEMKGVFSQPDQILFRKIQNSLFKEGHPYSWESGGDPHCIPDLTYEDFLDFHKRYYHPTNSFIYLYGNMNIEEKLTWLDKEYLSNFNTTQINSLIPMQESFQEPVTITDYFSIASNESDQDKSFISYNVSIDTILNKELYIAFQALNYVLLTSSGAKLKEALINANIGQDVFGEFDNSILQPIYSIVAKGTDVSKKNEFLTIIRDTLQDMVTNGIDKKQLTAAITKLEFKSREADYGRYPKGLIYGMKVMDSWLYSDDNPFKHLEYEAVYEKLKQGIDNGYFEKLIDSYLLHNTHASVVMIAPKKNLTSEYDNTLKNNLKQYKGSLSQEDIQKLIQDTENLKRYQTESSTKEQLEKIPLLKLEDIGKDALPFINEERDIDGIKVVQHEIFTSGIAYISLYFNMKHVPLDLVKYVGILKLVLTEMNTKNMTYAELSSELDIVTGGLGFGATTYSNKDNEDMFVPQLFLNTKALYSNIPKTFELMKEIILDTLFDDKKRLKDLLLEIKSKLATEISKSGHVSAINRALSYFSKAMIYKEKMLGMEYYKFLEDITEDFENNVDVIIEKLKTVSALIFNQNNLLISWTADSEGISLLEKEVATFVKHLDNHELTPVNYLDITPIHLNEGIMTSSQVQYVAKAGNFRKAGYHFTGALNVLKVIFSYDYLWNNVRVKGGAYGCMCTFSRNGNAYMVSYRDPNLVETLQIFNAAHEYIENFQAEDRDVLKFIIGTISDIDAPLSPSAKGMRSIEAYFSHTTFEDIQKSRNEILSVTVDKIRELAPLVRSVVECNHICVIGNEDKIKETHDIFNHKIELFK